MGMSVMIRDRFVDRKFYRKSTFVRPSLFFIPLRDKKTTFPRADIDQPYHKTDHQSPQRGRSVAKNGGAVDGVRALIDSVVGRGDKMKNGPLQTLIFRQVVEQVSCSKSSRPELSVKRTYLEHTIALVPPYVFVYT